MLSCIFLMGNLFVSDGDVMVAFSTMNHVERNGALLVIGSGARQDALDISLYPDDMPVHMILSHCAKSAEEDAPMDYASM